jgi:hypothetical protein
MFCLGSFTSRELTDLEKFYINNHATIAEFKGIKLDSDEKGLLLRSTEAIAGNTPYLVLHSSWVIPSCIVRLNQLFSIHSRSNSPKS